MSTTTESTETVAPSRISPKDRHDLMLLLIAGGVGGIASWVFGLVTGDPVPGGAWGAPAAIFLGAFAACVGIYLTNHDTSNLRRTLIFAMLCGFAWKPVCDAGKATVELAVQEKQDEAAQELGEEVQQLAATVSQTPQDELATKLGEIDTAAQSALEALPHVNSPRVRRDIEKQVNTALQTVVRVAPQQPQAAAKVIQSVGESAARVEAPKVTATAVTGLDTLATTNPTFSAANKQLQTNATDVIKRRYMLERRFRPPVSN